MNQLTEKDLEIPEPPDGECLTDVERSVWKSGWIAGQLAAGEEFRSALSIRMATIRDTGEVPAVERKGDNSISVEEELARR